MCATGTGLNMCVQCSQARGYDAHAVLPNFVLISCAVCQSIRFIHPQVLTIDTSSNVGSCHVVSAAAFIWQNFIRYSMKGDSCIGVFLRRNREGPDVVQPTCIT